MAKSKKKKTAAKAVKAKAKAKPVKKAVKAPAKKKAAPKKAQAKPVRAAARPVTKPDSRRRPKSLVRRAVEGAMRAMPRMMPRFGAASAGKYDADLERNPANFQALTPLTYLERAASVFPERTAIIHGRQRFTYAQYYARSRRLASAMSKAGIRKGDTVAVMLANTPPMLEAHYGVAMASGVLNALNTRLDAAALAFILDHGEAKYLITDREFSGVMTETLKLAQARPIVIDYDDPEFAQSGDRLGNIDYEAFL